MAVKVNLKLLKFATSSRFRNMTVDIFLNNFGGHAFHPSFMSDVFIINYGMKVATPMLHVKRRMKESKTMTEIQTELGFWMEECDHNLEGQLDWLDRYLGICKAYFWVCLHKPWRHDLRDYI